MEHFEEVVNCQVNTAVVPIDDLPVVSSLSNTSSLSDTDQSAPLSEEEIITAISELSSRKAPGLDGISLEMLSLGGDATIYWPKSIFDAVWVTESVPMDWQSHVFVPLHKKGSCTICDNYRTWYCSYNFSL